MAAADRSRVVAATTLALLAACGTPPYAPCPVELQDPLPADAFLRCREVLVREFGGIAEADAAAFRIQTRWQPVADPPGERRATVFLDRGAPSPDLAVIVELRWLTIPWFGVPAWSEARGDQAAERALASALREALEPTISER